MTVEVTVLLNTPEKISQFVDDVRDELYDVDLVSGRYVIDAKSILGIYTLNIAKPVKAVLHTSEKEATVLLEKIKAYQV